MLALKKRDKSAVLFDSTYVEWVHQFQNATVVGDLPSATVSSDAFLSSLLTASEEDIARNYTNAWVFLTDAQWVDYDPVLSRTLFKHSRCKLVVAVLSPDVCDLLPLVNLVRSNERDAPVLTRDTLDAGARGYVLWNKEAPPRWSYAVPPHTPFPESNVWPVFDPWTFLKQHLKESEGTIAVAANKPNVVLLKNLLSAEGFQFRDGAFRRGTTAVTLTQPHLLHTDVDELHVVDPENIAALLFHASAVNRNKLTVYLYAAMKSPLEEPPQLLAYRSLFNQHQTASSTVRDAVLGLFVLYPMHHRYAVLNEILAIHPDASKREILDELDDVCARKCTLLDQFGTKGTIIRSGNDYFFSKTL
jgi:hypothetical protein